MTQMGQIHPTYFVSCLHTSYKYCDVLIPDLSGKGQCWGTSALEVKCYEERKANNHDGNEVHLLPSPHLRVLILTVRTLRNESSSLSLLRIPMWSQVNTALALSFYINTLVNVPHLQKGHIANSTQTFQLTSKPCGCQLSSLERRKHHKRIHFHLLCGGGWNRW